MQYTNYESLPIFLTIDDLMALLNIGRNSAYDLIRSGQIYSLRVGRQIRIPKESIYRLCQKN